AYARIVIELGLGNRDGPASLLHA
ncbi:MAG: hypothetical protein RLZZ515_2607, partial [Cyanobacteriota bacterium]